MHRKALYLVTVLAIVLSALPVLAAPTPSQPLSRNRSTSTAASIPFLSSSTVSGSNTPLPSSIQPNTTTWDQLAPEIQAKIDPRISQELDGEVIPAHLGGRPDQAEVTPSERKPVEKTRFIVYLKAKSDLKAVTAQPFATLAQQRTAVADVLIATAQTTQGPVKSILDTRMTAGGVASYQPFYIFNGFAVEGNWDTVVELAQRDDVERIAANYPLIKYDQPTKASASPANGLGGLDPANWNIDLMDADRVWNEFGVRGEGAVVGGFDTGVQWDHPALKSQYRGWNGVSANHNYNWFEPNSTLYPGGNLGPSVSSVPTWCDNHGVHTMGTMVGDGGTADTKIGMAPGAKWIAVPGICGNTMPGNWGDDIGGNKAFQWFLCPTDLTGNLATRDCSKAPDVVNNSWGSSSPADETFRPAIQALRAAGIAPVFAAGNPGAGPGSIGSPGAALEAITVGATDINDKVASFSGRGPSFYEGVQKPNVTAPGVNIKSSVSGSSYDATYSGTSMAAPAVSGLVALMVSADLKDGKRDLNVDEIQKFIESTAVRLGATIPNDDYGYGRIDAYNAVRWVFSAGDLKGTVTDDNTSAPIDGATVNGVRVPDTFTTRSAANGAYSVTVPGGLYNVTVSAFGYNPGAFAGLNVITGANSIVDFSLTPLLTAILTGTVLFGTTPINGALVYVDAKPSLFFTTGANGMYTLTLPVGTHAVTVKATGYRIKHENVNVASGGTMHDLTMTPAPSILLVEAEGYRGWFYARSPHSFFKWSLDKKDYLYDTYIITSTTVLPTLTSYGVVIWAQTSSTPNSVAGFVTLLQNYLNAGGKLIISGKDIASAGGGTFLSNYLHASLANSSAAGKGDTVSGVGFLSGINLTLNESALYSYANTATSLTPDAVNPLDGSAYPVMSYNNGNGPAALAVAPCGAPYRAVYFAVGYESLGPRAYSRPPEYADVLDRSIQWVMGSKPAYGVNTFVVPGSKVSPPGSVFTYNLTVANTGINTDTYNLALAGNAWQTQILSGTTPATQTLQLTPCSRQALGVQVTAPGTAVAGATDTFIVTATSLALPTVNSAASARTTALPLWKIEAPMPTARYRLGAVELPGTSFYFAIGGQGGSGSLATNERYDACANTWTTMAPLPAARGNINAATMNGKIYVVGGYSAGPTYYDSTFVYDPATNTWSSAAQLPVALSGVAIATANGKLYAFGGSGASGYTDATYEYDPGTNTWTTKAPMPSGARGYATAAMLSGKIYVVGGWSNLNTVEVYDPASNTWSTAAAMNVGRQSPGLAAAPDGFLYVSGGGNSWTGLNSAERYNPTTNTWTIVSSLNNADRAGSASAYIAGRVFAIGGTGTSTINVNESLRLADAFCLSTKQVQQSTVQPGDRITYTIELHGDQTTLPNVRVLDPIPTGATFGSFGPATVSPAPTYNAGLNRVEWSGSLTGSQPPVSFTFGVLVNPTGWVNGQSITNTATFSDGVNLTFDRSATTTVNFFDLSLSTKNVNKAQAVAGEVLSYTIHVRNTSSQSGTVTLSDPIPANATYVPGSLKYTVGSAGYAGGVVTWTSQLTALLNAATITFAVTTTAPLLANTWITNTATFTDSRGVVYNRSAGTLFNSVILDGSTKTVDRTQAQVGAPVNYTLVVRNSGLYTATGASLSDPAPANTTWNGVAPACTSGTCGYASGVITWTGNITPGAAVTVAFGVTYTTPLPDRTPITNTATISNGLGGMLTRQAAFLARTPALNMAYKAVSPAVAQLGDVVTYSVYLYNSGGADGNAQLVDPVPTDLTYVPGSLVFGSGSGGYAGGVITWTGRVPASSQIQVQFRGTVNAGATDGAVVTNTATITDVTWNTSYQRSATFTVRRIADLYVNKAGPGTAGSGATLVYTLTYGNAGPNATPGAVNVADTLPVNATFVSASSGGVYSSTAGNVTWNVGALTSGMSGTLSLTLTANPNLPALTVLTNTAAVDAIPQDLTPANNTSQVLTVIGSNVNLLASTKTVDQATVNQGGTVTYTISLVNTGNVTASVTITDPIPTGATYVLGSGTVNAALAGIYNDATNRIEWSGLAPAGTMITIRFRAVITAIGGTTVTNTATLDDGAGTILSRQASTQSIRYQVYLPLVVRQ